MKCLSKLDNEFIGENPFIIMAKTDDLLRKIDIIFHAGSDPAVGSSCGKWLERDYLDQRHHSGNEMQKCRSTGSCARKFNILNLPFYKVKVNNAGYFDFNALKRKIIT